MATRDARGTLRDKRSEAKQRKKEHLYFLAHGLGDPTKTPLENRRPLTQQQLAEIQAEVQAQREEMAYDEMLYVHQQIGNGRKGANPTSLWHPRDNPETSAEAHIAFADRNRTRRKLFPSAGDCHLEWEGARYAIRHYGFASKDALGDHFEQSAGWAEELLQAMAAEYRACCMDGLPPWELDGLFPNRAKHTFLRFQELTITGLQQTTCPLSNQKGNHTS